MSYFSIIILVACTICSFFLLLYGLNTYFMIYLFLRKMKSGKAANEACELKHADRFNTPELLPVVTTQIPLYNEINVAERVIRAVAGIEYPQARHEIQVLDDSDDETCALVDRVAAELREAGYLISVFRRDDRVGYKAGALEAGMAVCKGEYIAIFDSDFIPPKDFLIRTLPHLWEDERCGLVQARWDHINEEKSWLTRAQAMGVDGHFVVEQTARNQNGLFMNFCGTAGVWRRIAIEESGGWQHDTITEDLDLSYRAQLGGWKFRYLPDLLVPAELPETYSAFKSQQYRWAKGSIQTARKTLPRLWRARIPFVQKVEGTVHLTQYGLHFLMAVLALLLLPLVLNFQGGIAHYRSDFFFWLLLPAAVGPSVGYIICQYCIHPDSWKSRVARLPFLLLVGFGICLSNANAVVEGAFGNDNTFVRTPKSGEKLLKEYLVKRSWVPQFEVILSLYCAVTIASLGYIGQYALIPFVAIYAMGFGLIGVNSLCESRLSRV
ncbi:MAG: cellulose synthase/poly-beta-1,6-N-acetylglucosamine synthase-like glycosyltransferase [Lentimonas sp.]|jgi:cellulose synthase/poly-beta-1,6-N-acetylglucosamine synthase-like glycosyltransferase